MAMTSLFQAGRLEKGFEAFLASVRKKSARQRARLVMRVFWRACLIASPLLALFGIGMFLISNNPDHAGAVTGIGMGVFFISRWRLYPRSPKGKRPAK
jgi:hypothetical protein